MRRKNVKRKKIISFPYFLLFTFFLLHSNRCFPSTLSNTTSTNIALKVMVDYVINYLQIKVTVLFTVVTIKTTNCI